MAKKKVEIKFVESPNFKRGKAAVIEAEQLIEYGSPKHQGLLESAYGMKLGRAKEIIAERSKNALAFPYEFYEKAQAMIEALSSKPVPISQKPGWKRDEREYVGGIE